MKFVYLKLILGIMLCGTVSGDVSLTVEGTATQSSQVSCGVWGTDGRFIMGSCSECKQKCSITWADGTANGDCAGAATWKTVCENGVWGTSEAEGNCHRQASCDYGDRFVEFYKDDNFDINDNDHWKNKNIACRVPWGNVQASKDHMKEEFECDNDKSKSMRICHADAGNTITVFDKDDHKSDVSQGSYLEIKVKVNLRGRCATVKNFNEVDEDTDELSYSLYKKGNGKLNNKISSFIICSCYDCGDWYCKSD